MPSLIAFRILAIPASPSGPDWCSHGGGWENGRHSTNNHIYGLGRVAPTPYRPCRAWRTRKEERPCLLGHRIRDLVGFRKAIFLFCHENGMEEWSAFHQYSPILARTSEPISVVEQPSLPQTLIGESSPPWLSNSRFLGFQIKFVLFFKENGMWKNGRHFINIHPFWRERVVLSL
jgi:hypothetical protein